MILSFCIDFERLLLFSVSVLILRFSCLSELFLALLYHFAWLCRFSCSFLGFLGLLAMLHGVLDLNFKLCAFVVNGLIKGEIEKPSDQFLGLIVMSH
jgi:hypothetical protein